jgi:hypothetical protein
MERGVEPLLHDQREKLALALGRTTAEVKRWFSGDEPIDADVLLKAAAARVTRAAAKVVVAAKKVAAASKVTANLSIQYEACDGLN